MNLIGIAGRMGHGKDTVAEIIRELTPSMNWEIKKFAGKLKQIASILTGIPVAAFEDPEVKARNLPGEWDSAWREITEQGSEPIQMTVRELLQKLGTDAIRDHLHPNAWVNALFADYVGHIASYLLQTFPDRIIRHSDPIFPNWLITDVRFPNEAMAIVERGGIVVKVDRGVMRIPGEHISETALDNWDFDFTINNYGSIGDLKASVEAILRHYGIGQYGDGYEGRR